MAYENIAILRRFILIENASAVDLRINRNDVVHLNAGRYQLDVEAGIKTLEIDGVADVQQSPVGLGFLTSVDGLPVSITSQVSISEPVRNNPSHHYLPTGNQVRSIASTRYGLALGTSGDSVLGIKGFCANLGRYVVGFVMNGTALWVLHDGAPSAAYNAVDTAGSNSYIFWD